ncbi:MAG TPA: C2H2 type zinc finger domain-containing protein [Acidimicrobiales bacterium]|jgi:hypothetical protein|nr:C2H2 type zinc finger domain-containing protein [Acidimicrobiales bacterium]
MEESVACPVCGTAREDLAALASHLVESAEASDGRHVMWLNRNATKHRISAAGLQLLLGPALAGDRLSSDRIKR